ncbi:MAG TPA: peptide-methionine (R)-S-oxide reductase, partial [Bacteroidia bacterium]|nr:peptide-methionine (R)-S-oxide reductase [Bacteroidia bacterium]
MKIRIFNIALVTLMGMWQLSIAQNSRKMEYNKLTPQEEKVLLFKVTDRPFTGDYYLKKDVGTYICRRC